MAKRMRILSVVLLFGVGYAADAVAQVIGPPTNLNFERGLEGWTTFTTPGGTLGPEPLPTIMNVSLNGRPVSKAVAIAAGQQPPIGSSIERGGGLYQQFQAPAGRLRVLVDVGVYFTSSGQIPDTGTFWVIVDGQLVSSLNMGQLGSAPWAPPGYAKSSRLGGTLQISAGTHTLAIAVTRPWGNGGPVLYHFIDHVVLAMDLEDSAAAAPTNLDFERGLSGWTTFKTAGGTLGPSPYPTTRRVSINGKPTSNAAAFSAGQRSAAESGASEQGGGLAQVFQAPAGRLLAFVDLAARADNVEVAGTFWVFVDNQLLSSVEIGRVQGYSPFCIPFDPVCPPFVPGFKSLFVPVSVTIGEGAHFLAIAATRPFESGGVVEHLIDHVVLAMDLSVDGPTGNHQ